MKRNRLIRSILIAALAINLLHAPTIYAAEEVRLMLVERNPWLMVIGSDSPTFVMYETRRAIWWDGSKENGRFVTAILSETEAGDLLRESHELSRLDDYISLSDWTDQSTQEFHFWSNGKLARRDVYGSLRPPQEKDPDSEERASAPPQILKIFDRLTDFITPTAQPWSPAFLEVMIWPYEYAPDESIVWPVDWPDIDSPTTRHRGDSHSLYIPYSEKSKLYEFLDKRAQKGAVVVNNRKWAVAVRLPFPHEVDFGGN